MDNVIKQQFNDSDNDSKEKGYPFKTKTKVCKKFTSKIILT